MTIDTAHDATTGVTTVWLDRPERLNALTYGLVDDLRMALTRIAQDPAVRAVVITGRGRAFSAGLDLDEDLDQTVHGRGLVASRYSFQQRLADVAVQLHDLPQPVVAALHGPVVGAGFGMALACDLRVLDPTSVLDPAFVRVGLGGAEMGVSWLLPQVIGAGRANDLMLTGRRIDALESDRIGLASRLVEEGCDVTAAQQLAAEIAARAPLAVRMTREVARIGRSAPDLRTAIEVENRTQVLCTLTDDFDEAVRAFLHRRPPTFHDR